MARLSTYISDDEPTLEPGLVLKIDYSENSGSAARVFEIAADLIRSLEDMDRVLTQSIHMGLETALVVEDLQKSSLRIFLRNVLRGLPDEALKDGDVKKLVGHYLYKAKYAAIKWLDEPEGNHRPITDLTEEIALLARETDMLHLPDYPAPNPARLAQPLDRFQEAKKRFSENESLIITLGKDEYTVDLGSDWLPSETVGDLDEIKELVNEQDIYLIIGKPDFIGNAKWVFRHGKRSLSLRIEDQEWLMNFKNGRFPIKPGDALRVRLRTENKYDEKGNLTSTDELIVRVLGVIEGSGETGDLFES